MLKCFDCYSILEEEDLVEGKCPCGGTPKKMCALDHVCTCIREHSEGIKYCPECGQNICPCGSHDVVVISRVTGYLADVSGFNSAKRAELRDRHRYNIGVT
jgi:hypothetical protein